MQKLQILLLALVSISMLTYSCSDFSDINSVEKADEELEMAVPLVNTEFNISDFTGEVGTNNVSIKLDAEDRVTLVYSGDVVRQGVFAIFTPVPFYEIPLIDTSFSENVPFQPDQGVDRAIFGDSNIRLRFTSQFEEDVDVKIILPQLSKDGEIFTANVTVPYEGTSPVDFISEPISIEGWLLESAENIITIIYDARLSDGSRVAFTEAVLAFDVVIFDYIEGYFGSEIFDIKGDFIPIGVLDNWVSGGLSFEDPKVKIFVENAFGFPVRSIFNTMQVETTTGEILDMESEIIDNNIDFAYPALDERGEIKITEFSFNRDNSNIVDLFQEKVRRVSYDIDAGANPDMDESIVGFVDADSYFLVKVDVELPLEGSVNNLVLQDTVDLDLSDLDDVTSAEFKTVVANDFPADITVQGFFYDENDVLLDSLFEERLLLPAAQVDMVTGRAIPGDEIVKFEEYSSERVDVLQNGSKILVNVKINTEQASSGPLWIYNDYGITFKLGAKLRTKL